MQNQCKDICEDLTTSFYRYNLDGSFMKERYGTCITVEKVHDKNGIVNDLLTSRLVQGSRLGGPLT